VDDRHFSELLDLIYGSALQPELWERTLERIADSMGGHRAWLSQIAFEDGNGSGVVARVDPVFPERYYRHYASINPYVKVPDLNKHLAHWVPRILTDEDVLQKEALLKTEYYNDFLAPQQVHNFLMIDLDVNGTEVATVNILRPKHSGQFAGDALRIAEALHPHLIRAFKLGTVFSGFKRTSDDQAAALDCLGQGLFILDPGGRIRHANRQGEHILALRSSLLASEGKLVAALPSVGKRLEAMIGKAGSAATGSRSGGAMVIPCSSGDPLYLTVAPLDPKQFSLFTNGPSVLVSASTLRSTLSISDQSLKDALGLTTAEARIARQLFNGSTPREIAQKTGVSLNTIRSQLASIYQKTQTTGQAELSRLMMSVASASFQ
jgi:DNA-binding CsgD family transcriptional regulator/PAS domain-containing protein